MLFNSITYIFFLLIFVPPIWLVAKNYRHWVILFASLLFYGFWKIEYVFLISFSALVDYYFAIKIYKQDSQKYRKFYLWLSISINLSLLAYFKYTFFIIENISYIGKIIGTEFKFIPNIILPLGISFYTFLSISYTIDVYRKTYVPIKNFGVYLTYVMFWPHMIAGPILRASELINQIINLPNFKLINVVNGLKIIFKGLFLKVVLADQLAPWVDEAFAVAPLKLSGIDVWTMAFGFGLQIYFDFAGYSMIAIGSALLIGIQFPENFNWPYLATSPREFWKCWHITLSAWIRDYLYLPLCGLKFSVQSMGGIDIKNIEKKDNFLKSGICLFITWFIMGLWHGAAWKFAFWGIWHATVIVIYRILSSNLNSFPLYFNKTTGWFLTILVVMIGWIPFRATSLSNSFELILRIFDFKSYQVLTFRENFYLIVFLITICMFIVWLFGNIKTKYFNIGIISDITEIIFFSMIIFVVFIFLEPGNQFIYFQF